MHEVLVNRLGGLSLPRKSVVRLTDRPDMTLDVYRGRKTTMQQQCNAFLSSLTHFCVCVCVWKNALKLQNARISILHVWSIVNALPGPVKQF